jgi:hypothetical protein
MMHTSVDLNRLDAVMGQYALRATSESSEDLRDGIFEMGLQLGDPVPLNLGLLTSR